MRQFDFTTSIVELTFNHCQWAVLLHMAIKILPFSEEKLHTHLSIVLGDHTQPVVVNNNILILCRFMYVIIGCLVSHHFAHARVLAQQGISLGIPRTQPSSVDDLTHLCDWLWLVIKVGFS